MYTFDFDHKIRQLNPALYVANNHLGAVAAADSSTGIYYKCPKRSKTGLSWAQMQVVDARTQRYMQALSEGSLDEYVEGIPAYYVPEYDVFDLQTGLLVQKGWRTAVLGLVKKGFCNLARARQVFTSSLGEADYDRLGFEAKLSLARKEAP